MVSVLPCAASARAARNRRYDSPVSDNPRIHFGRRRCHSFEIGILVQGNMEQAKIGIFIKDLGSPFPVRRQRPADVPFDIRAFLSRALNGAQVIFEVFESRAMPSASSIDPFSTMKIS